jgi:sugar lactone lactonase YvrE
MNERAPAPEFPAGLSWVNVSRPPRIADLRGRVALLWFWSYDAVNCWNLIPDLRHLEEKYHDGLTVIGVHCPKHPQQCGDEPLLRAVNRHRLRHAMANDAGFEVWQDYGIDAWPSVVLVDAEGHLAARIAGEGRRDDIDAQVARLLEQAALLDLRIYEPALPALRPEPDHALAFPGKVLADGERLYVADSGHHRVLECDHDGRVRRRFGSGIAGFGDGDLSIACFNDPQGLARHGGSLYVADRGNHSVRRIDLDSGRVDTVLGIGRAGRTRPENAEARSTALNTPLDLAVIGDDLYVAVAGQNQIWRLDLRSGRVSVLAGSGEPARADGAFADAAFAQPSGLAAAGRTLFVADAATSSVRAVLVDQARVETAIGGELYPAAETPAPLCNPLAVAADARGTLYVADSYHGEIKLANRRSGELWRLRMPYRLHEPQGLSLADGRLWIANTNLHEIACVDLSSGAVRRVPVDED